MKAVATKVIFNSIKWFWDQKGWEHLFYAVIGKDVWAALGLPNQTGMGSLYSA